ncbi:MAG: putative baseplate assembly protein [Chloroflexi bacterium]|nr:putative baseplate assembly protein [Chloroflexota bacterium]
MSLTADPNARQGAECGCCEGLQPQTPARIYNRPGLAAIAYRTGDHARFKASMLAALSAVRRRPALGGLRTREDDDPSLALLDAWATIADVLTFYQERIANESYLRTATERLSVAYLAALTGYHLQPGVAASTYLAFTLEDSPGATTLPAASIGVGTRVQSIPSGGGLPQTFETVQAVTGRPEWNALKPRLTQPQVISKSVAGVTVKGLATTIKAGDSVLIVESPGVQALRTVTRTSVTKETQTTYVELDRAGGEVLAVKEDVFERTTFPVALQPLSNAAVNTHLIGYRWRAADVVTLASVQRWSLRSLKANISHVLGHPTTQPDAGIFLFRRTAAPFGYNAPVWQLLSETQRGALAASYGYTEPDGWEGRTVQQDSGADKNLLYLDTTYPAIATESWIVLRNQQNSTMLFQVADNVEMSRTAYTVSGKVSRLKVKGTLPSSYKLRETSVLVESERIELAEAPLPEQMERDAIALAGAYPELAAGQPVIVTGEPLDPAGQVTSEVATLLDVTIEGGYTRLYLKKPLAHDYVRKTVTFNANVALATHGETKQEVLGSGDASQAYQSFKLKHPPLTYVVFAESGKAESTLEVRVNDLLWHEAEDLARLGPHDRRYIVRLADDGSTTITFGDGEHGARLPTGVENVSATYRSGSGLDGQLDAGQLALLTRRPPGVRAVTNPTPTTGADDAASRDAVRRNAPLAVLTLDRIVSLQDYEDYARAFPGVAKALATLAWEGQTQAVFLTVVGPRGDELPQDGQTLLGLLTALRKYGDPHTPLHVRSCRQAWFQVQVNVKVHGDYVQARVFTTIEQALRDRFSFDAREFGQPVSIGEVVAAVQNVPGVVAADVDYLYRTYDQKAAGELVAASPAWNAILLAERPRSGADVTTMLPAELLTLDPRPLTLGVMP